MSNVYDLNVGSLESISSRKSQTKSLKIVPFKRNLTYIFAIKWIFGLEHAKAHHFWLIENTNKCLYKTNCWRIKLIGAENWTCCGLSVRQNTIHIYPIPIHTLYYNTLCIIHVLLRYALEHTKLLLRIFISLFSTSELEQTIIFQHRTLIKFIFFVTNHYY